MDMEVIILAVGMFFFIFPATRYMKRYSDKEVQLTALGKRVSTNFLVILGNVTVTYITLCPDCR